MKENSKFLDCKHAQNSEMHNVEGSGRSLQYCAFPKADILPHLMTSDNGYSAYKELASNS